MTALIILAAGESKRFGKPKQNLVYNGHTLLQRTAEAGLASECATVVVVLGAYSEQIQPISETATLYNVAWKEGMASSIKLAIQEIDKENIFDSVIITLCDQPFVNPRLLNALIDKHAETGKAIVASSYKDTVGVPVLLDVTLFADLLQLNGKEGAKKILKDHPEDLVTIPFEQGDIDIDTPEDYERLLNSGN